MSGSSDPWAFADRSPYAWTDALVRELRHFAFPALGGPTLLAYSDYAGLDRQSRFWVMALLLIDLSASTAWNSRRTAVRERFLADGRRMAYKNLNDATPEAVNTFLGILHPPKPGPIPLTPPNATDLSKLPH